MSCTTEVIQSWTLAVMSSVMYTCDWLSLRKSGWKLLRRSRPSPTMCVK